jgi:hypothetical protein
LDLEIYGMDNEKIKDNHSLNELLRYGAIACLLIGSSILFYFVFSNLELHANGKPLNLKTFAEAGDFIAGVVGTLFSLAGFFLLYLTFQNQRDNFHRERLESNFFEMIKFHRENIQELTYKYYDPKENEDINQRITAEKREVFKMAFIQFKEAWKELNHLFSRASIEDIYQNDYRKAISANLCIKERKINLKQYAQIDIIYLIVFFGVGKEDRKTILNILSNKYNTIFLTEIINYAALKPRKEENEWGYWIKINKLSRRFQIFEEIIKKRNNSNYESELLDPTDDEFEISRNNFNYYYKDNYIKYYGGHQFRLGHYFRHIYQSVKYIDKEALLTYEDKYAYIKILRGQLSNYEQIMFFLNSLSEIGRTWEFEKKNKPEKAIKINKQLITKYNLIKNIPTEIIVDEIKLTDYYPNVEYEAIKTFVEETRKSLIVEYS